MKKEERNKFHISEGNLEVLKTIPEMMNDPEWRDKLRRLVIDYKLCTYNDATT